jgi:hypothetical protein
MYGDYQEVFKRRPKEMSDTERENRYDFLADLYYRISKLGHTAPYIFNTTQPYTNRQARVRELMNIYHRLQKERQEQLQRNTVETPLPEPSRRGSIKNIFQTLLRRN